MAGDNLPNKSNAFKGTVNSIRRRFKRLLINSMSEERLQDKLDKIVDSDDFYQILEFISLMSERKLEESYPSISHIINNYNSKNPQMMIQLFDSLPSNLSETLSILLLKNIEIGDKIVFRENDEVYFKAIEKSNLKNKDTETAGIIIDNFNKVVSNRELRFDFIERIFENVSPEVRGNLFEKVLIPNNINFFDFFSEKLRKLFMMLEPEDRGVNYLKILSFLEKTIDENGSDFDKKPKEIIDFVIQLREALPEDDKKESIEQTVKFFNKVPKEFEKDFAKVGTILKDMTPQEQDSEFLLLLNKYGTEKWLLGLTTVYEQLDVSVIINRAADFFSIPVNSYATNDERKYLVGDPVINLIFKTLTDSFAKLDLDDKKKYIDIILQQICSVTKEDDYVQKHRLRNKYLIELYKNLDDSEKDLFFDKLLNCVDANDIDENEPRSYIESLVGVSNNNILFNHYTQIFGRFKNPSDYLWCVRLILSMLDENQVEQKYQETREIIEKNIPLEYRGSAYVALYKASSRERKLKEWKSYITYILKTSKRGVIEAKYILKSYFNALDGIEEKEKAKLCQEVFDYLKNETDIPTRERAILYNTVFENLPDSEKHDKFIEYFDEVQDKDFVARLFHHLPNEMKEEFFTDFFLADESKLPYVIKILAYMSLEDIANIFKDVSFSKDLIKKIMSADERGELSVKLLFFDEDIDKEKLYDLSLYDKLKNKSVISVESVLKKIVLNESLSTEEINQRIDSVYNLFTYNNIPEFLKTFRMFQLSGDSIYGAENERIESYRGKTHEERDELVLQELFVLSLCSNNNSLRNFLVILHEGKAISAKLQGNPSEKIKKLSKTEMAILSQYRDTLFELYNFINEMKNTGRPSLKQTDNIARDLNAIVAAYSREGKSNNYVINTSKLFNELLGNISNSSLRIEDMLEFMKEAQEESQERHFIISDGLRSGQIRLEPGDYIKGIGNFADYFYTLLRTSLKGGEFNQDHSHSDSTKLDCDFGYITEGNIGSDTDRGVIETTISATYGKTWVVLKNYEERLMFKGRTKISDGCVLNYEPDGYGEIDKNGRESRYLRVGVPVLDIDYLVSEEWEDRFGYEMAMAGIFIPVVDGEGNLVFSKDDYFKIREKMAGLSEYGMRKYDVDQKATDISSLFEVYKEITQKEDSVLDDEFLSIKSLISGVKDSDTATKKEKTLRFLLEFFRNKSISVTNNISHNLSSCSVELIDTGSTGRGTNLPGDGDFDFMLRHNLRIADMKELQEYVKVHCEGKFDVVSTDGDFRAKDVVLPTGEHVDIDITQERKSLELDYSSDLCVKDRLESIKEQYPEKYNYIIANIIMAKKILKAIGLYKKRGSDGATEYGGFGGIGVENWILQNGGSFAKAIDTFLEAAKSADSYVEFIKNYPIFDFGSNHRSTISKHDRYSAFLGTKENDKDYGFRYAVEQFSAIQKIMQRREKTSEDVELVSPLVKSCIEPTTYTKALKGLIGYSASVILASKYGLTQDESLIDESEV